MQPMVVTGAAGQLGRRVTELLLEEGHRVHGSDRAGAPFQHERLFWSVSDLAAEAPCGWPADAAAVIHLAGSKNDGPFSFDAAVEQYRANVLTAAHALAGTAPGARFVLVSSLSVYGASASEGASEDAPPSPQSLYGTAKLMAEEVCRAVGREPMIIVRLAQVYGPGTAANNGLYRLIAQALATGGMQLDCAPDLRRDYVHVDDAADAICRAATKAPPGTYNAGSAAPVTMLELSEAVRAAVRDCAPAQFARAASAAWEHRYLVSEKLRTTISWHPCIELRNGVRAEVERVAKERQS